MTGPPTTDLQYYLRPTEDLILEVLAARHRLGEQIWTFKSRHSDYLRNLEINGLVFTMHGITEGTIRAGLTDDGLKYALDSSYVPPNRRHQ